LLEWFDIIVVFARVFISEPLNVGDSEIQRESGKHKKKKPKEKWIDDGFESGVTMMMKESRIKQTLESSILI
jgi:hypothetical protein